jgi:O-antigen/teichoic acid export membrane protein
MTKKSQFIKDILRYLPSRLLPALTAFITTPILTRLFPPTEYSQWALASGVNDFYLAFATASFGSAAIRYYPIFKAKSESSVFYAVFGVSLGTIISVVSVASLSILLLFRKQIPDELFPLLLLTIPIFIVQAVFTVLLSLTRAQERSGLYTTFHLIYRYGSLGLGLVLVMVFGLRVNGLLWGAFLSLLLTTPLLFILSTKGERVQFDDFQVSAGLEIWRFTWPLALGNVALWGLRLSDRYIINYFRPESEVGLYSVAYNISGKSIDILVTLFLLSISPMLMNVWENGDRETTENAMMMATRLYLILCFPAAVGLSVLAPGIIALLAAEAYHEGYRIVAYVAFASFVWGLATLAHTGVMIKKKALRLGINQVIAASINFILNILFVPRFGFVAAGINTLLGFTILFFLQLFASRKHLTWRFPFKTLRNVVISAVFMGGTVWGIYCLSGDLCEPHPMFLLLSIVVAIPVYFACLWLLGEMKDDEKEALERYWQKMAKRLR